jgi:hypothetical protein
MSENNSRRKGFSSRTTTSSSPFLSQRDEDEPPDGSANGEIEDEEEEEEDEPQSTREDDSTFADYMMLEASFYLNRVYKLVHDLRNEFSNRTRKGKLKNPDQIARSFCDAVAFAFNAQDPFLFRQILSFLCIPGVQIKKILYSTLLLEAKIPPLQENCYNLDSFAFFYYAFWCYHLPDGIMRLISSRSCLSTAPTYVFISTFNYRGHLLSKEVDLLHFEHVYHTPMVSLSVEDFDVDGSLTVFVNEHGLIEDIELYFDQK